MKDYINIRDIVLLLLFSVFISMFANGSIAFTNPDEVFYAQTAKEMSQHHTWMVPYIFGQPQFEKPIFLYWLLRLSFLVCGVTTFAGRFFPALFAVFAALGVYLLGILGFRDSKKALISGLIFISSALCVGLAKTVFTDLIFSVFILFSFLAFFWGYTYKENRPAAVILSFIFSGLAVLTKGPLGFLIPASGVAVFLFIRKDKRYVLTKSHIIGVLIFAAITMPWYAYVTAKYGQAFTHEFFYNDHWRRFIEAEHPGNDRWYFYPLSVIGCMFPWSLYSAVALFYLFRRNKYSKSAVHVFLGSWICLTLLIFQVCHSKLASYIFPLFPAVALITGDFICDSAIIKKNMIRNVYMLAFLPFILVCAIPLAVGRVEPYVSSKLSSEYLLKNYRINNAILCSKPYVRGVKFYTDKDVAIMDIGGKEFFSPHPVPFLNSGQKIIDFLRSQRTTYCVLKKSAAEDMVNILDKKFKVLTLKVEGNEYIIKIEYSE